MQLIRRFILTFVCLTFYTVILNTDLTISGIWYEGMGRNIFLSVALSILMLKRGVIIEYFRNKYNK